MNWFERLSETPEIEAIARAVEQGGDAQASGAIGSSTAILVAALARRTTRPILHVVAHLDEVDDAADELRALGVTVEKLPAMEIMPGESSVNLELLAERLVVVRRLIAGEAPPVTIAAMPALMQLVATGDALGAMYREIRPGMTLDVPALAGWLSERGYDRVETIESPGEFAIRGGIIDVFPAGGAPTRIDLFGDEVEAIFAVDLDSMGSDRRLDRLDLVASTTEDLQRDQGVPAPSLFPGSTIAVLSEILELNEQGRSYEDRVSDHAGLISPADVFKSIGTTCHAVLQVNHVMAADGAVPLPIEPVPAFSETLGTAIDELVLLAGEMRTVVFCQNEGEAARLRELVVEHAGATPPAALEILEQFLHRGVLWGDGAEAIALVPYQEIVHRYHARRQVRRLAARRTMDVFLDVQPGDYVVHRDHGIAKFLGLRTLGGSKKRETEEFLTLEFARGSKLNVPATKIDLVQKYVGAFGGRPELSTIGGARWKKQKERVTDAVRDLASEMLRLQAVREAQAGIRFPADTIWQHEFEAEFPYQETDDQLTAIAAVKRDMTSGRPMDRLICGDVGFGKTEVAIRAAFKAVEYGRQVAVLVPTTVLAEQHERTFKQRFADYPFRIESLSRFKSRKMQKPIIEDIKLGKVDVVIGTHRLLSADVSFADLGLVVIDEEQRFGVEHKQKLLEFRTTVDVLTLSATPIPRTLHMAMLGIRDISSLSTPPLDRRAIVTEVMPHDRRRVKQALLRELAREGQIFVVHNRVYDILSFAGDIQTLVPDAKIVVGHGQMRPRELEKVMLTFMRGEADILVSTTIIESGIDIPTANTMIIHDAHIFGLSDLHQLRGRVGRYKHRAYCYLLLPDARTVTEVAMKRLRSLETFSMLGAGFKIALRDLEIRGAGNLLGAEQSGHIAAVGYEMYCQLLQDAVRNLKNEDVTEVLDTTIDLGIEGSLPKGYIPSDARRMDAYRRISQAADREALEQIGRDLASAYGDLPARSQALFDLAEIRIAAAKIGVRAIMRRDDDIVLRTAEPGALDTRMKGVKGTVRLVGDVDAAGLSTVYFRPPKNYLESGTLLAVLRRRLSGEGAAKVTVGSGTK